MFVAVTRPGYYRVMKAQLITLPILVLLTAGCGTISESTTSGTRVTAAGLGLEWSGNPFAHARCADQNKPGL